MGFVAMLEAGRRDFLEAIHGISPDQVSVKVSPNGWSVLECIEHVAFVEEGYLNWILKGRVIEPQRDAEKEMRLFSTIRSRLTKVDAAGVLRPRGRFKTLAEALAEFEAVRERSVQLAKERGEGLYSVGIKHPYFGTLNGVELLQLIDGHARRHADQIREIRESLVMAPEVKGKIARPKKTGAFKRDAPDLPAELESTDVLGDGEFITIQDGLVRSLERTNLRINTFRIEGSVLESVQLAGGEFRSVVWKDVRLVGCDLANIRAHRMALMRVELIDCRLTGLSATALDWQDVLIQNGDARYAQLQGGTFRNCEFVGCKWNEADLQNADLTGSVFRSCELARADLHGAKLQNTDFRSSEVEGMVVGMNDLRGAIVDPAQAMIFARVLGLQIV
jgi:uncharacterized protein YjbI with pentapeptide repeats